MAYGRCTAVATSRRTRHRGLELQVTLRLDRASTIELVREMLERVGLQATFTPISGADGDGSEE